jgi:hypothetical protein
MPKDVTGEWTVVQSNGFQVKIHVEGQSGETCEGKATLGGTRVDLVNAWATDSEFVFTVVWPGPFRGRYSGRFDLEGYLAGVTFDENNPLSQATWVCPDKRFTRPTP